MRSDRRKIFGAIGVLAVLGAIAGLALLLWPNDATEITKEQAVKSFRDRSSSSATPADVHPTDRSTPEPGVYAFAAEGQEEVKLGPLPAETRTFPASVTAAVIDAGPGCFTWTSNLFAEHTEETKFCTEPVLRLESHTKHQKVGPLTPTFTMTCDPGALPALNTKDGNTKDGSVSTTRLTRKLVVGGGPVSVDTAIEGTATRTSESATIQVGSIGVPTTRIDVRFPVTGTINGTWNETTWWSADHLPVRIERTLDLSGPATFKETSRLQLTSLTPTA